MVARVPNETVVVGEGKEADVTRCLGITALWQFNLRPRIPG